MLRNHFTGTSAPQTSPFCSVSLHLCFPAAVAIQGFHMGTWIFPHLGWGCHKELTPFAVVSYGSLHCSLFFYCPAICFLHIWVLVFPCPSCVNSLVPLCPCAYVRRSLCLSLNGTWAQSKGSTLGTYSHEPFQKQISWKLVPLCLSHLDKMHSLNWQKLPGPVGEKNWKEVLASHSTNRLNHLCVPQAPKLV